MTKILKLQEIESEIIPTVDRKMSTTSIGFCSHSGLWSMASLYIC